MLSRERATTRRCRDDHGLALLMTGMLMVPLLLMTAFAVDIGAQLAERRQDQTAADAGALAGIQTMFRTASRSSAAADAIAMVRRNLPTKYSDSVWTSMWTACTDPNHPPEFTDALASSLSPCIRFNQGGTRLRVMLPNQLIQTSFAQVIGINQLSSSASAIAQLNFAGATPLPFALMSGADIGNQLCAAMPANCGGQSSDDLRVLDSPIVGNLQFGTTSFRDCPTGTLDTQLDYGTQTRTAMNTAMGIDHLILRYAPPRRDDLCDRLFPNHVFWYDLQNFNNSPNFSAFLAGYRDGLIGSFSGLGGPAFPDGQGPRLTRTPNQTRPIGGIQVDDRPLWSYIPSALGSPNIPSQCTRNTIRRNRGADEWKTATSNCLRAYTSKPMGYYKPLFTERSAGTPVGQYDAQLSPRFAVIPRIDTNSFPSPVVSWRYGFIQTIYTGDSVDYNPGMLNSSTLNAPNFSGVSMFQIQDGMLPVVMQPTQTGFGTNERSAIFSLIK